MLRFGYISEMDAVKGLARVTFLDDEIVSPWMPITVPNAKDHKWSFPLAVDEFVWCIVSDNMETGIVGGAIYNNKQQPAITGKKIGVKFSDDSSVEFDPESGKLTINTNGEVEITTATKVKIVGDLEVSGSVTADGEVTAMNAVPAVSVSLSTHIHPTPGGPSSAPTPGT